MTPAAHHEQVGSLGRVDQYLPGWSFGHARADLGVGVDGVHLGDRLGEDVERVLLVIPGPGWQGLWASQAVVLVPYGPWPVRATLRI